MSITTFSGLGRACLARLSITIHSPIHSEAAGLQLAFSTTTGLAYQTVDGATCADCTADDNWLLNVSPLAAGASHRVTVTGQLAADLSGLSTVTTTVALKFDAATLDEASLSHRVDGQPPTVSVSRAGETIKPGLQTIYGQASDGDGIGVGSVQARQAGTGTWQDASGTLLWAFEVDVPVAPTFQLEAQAKDQHDQTSDVVLAEFTVDAMPPVVNWSLPAILSGDHADIGGTATDLYPVGGEVNQVEVQLDQDTASWQSAQVYAPDATGSQNWLWTWALPREDGVPHTLRVRATDVVSNTSPASDWQSTLVDTVTPVVTVTGMISEVIREDYQPGAVTGPPVLTGTASDGGGVKDVIVHVNLPNGDSYQDTAILNGSEWSYTPELTQGGHHTLRLEVADQAGNASLEGPYDLEVQALDSDGDGVPDETDNCVDTPNPDQADSDGDGVGNVCDNCPADANPGQEDFDGDGTGDACDNTINNQPTSTGSGVFTLQTSAGYFSFAAGVENPSPADAPDLDFLHGFFSFTIEGLPPGGTAVVTITMPDTMPTETQYWKYGPTLANPVDHWYQIPMGDNDGDNVITITITDGGDGDGDLTVNGAIVEPGGPGQPRFTLTVNNTAGGGSGTVTSDPAGINCGADCAERYDQGTVVTLRAYPGVKSYVEWSGDCTGTGITTQITMDGDKTCIATFGYPVGGFIVPVNKLGLVAPWLGLVAVALLVAALAIALVRRRQT